MHFNYFCSLDCTYGSIVDVSCYGFYGDLTKAFIEMSFPTGLPKRHVAQGPGRYTHTRPYDGPIKAAGTSTGLTQAMVPLLKPPLKPCPSMKTGGFFLFLFFLNIYRNIIPAKIFTEIDLVAQVEGNKVTWQTAPCAYFAPRSLVEGGKRVKCNFCRMQNLHTRSAASSVWSHTSPCRPRGGL